MNFNQAYNYLLSLQSLPRKEYMKDPKHCSVYLKRLQFFLDILGNPEKKIPHYIHVTGTSGKGSTVAFLHSILNEAGYKVGSTQSPHPTTITERWQVGNKYMSKSEFVELIEFIKPKLDEYIKTSPYDMLSFFEICEAIGFLYFKKKKVKWAILEVGLGGRYDASNIIPYKDVAIITNIGLDHTNILGNDKKVIAYEKAGIIKKGCMVFTGERNKKILEFESSEVNKILLTTPDNLFELEKNDSEWHLEKPEKLETQHIGHDLLWSLKGLEFKSIVSPPLSEKLAGLDTPTFTISLWKNDQVNISTLKVGKLFEKEQEYIVQAGNQQYRIKNKSLDSIPRTLGKFRP